MLTDEISVSSASLVISVAVLLPIITVVAGCAFCRRLCFKKDEEDEERRPLLTANRREQSPRTETVETEHSTPHDRDSGEQPSPTNTGNRINVPCTVHVNVTTEENQTRETQTGKETEANLIPDLLKTDEDQAVVENFDKIHFQFGHQGLESVLEPRPAAKDAPAKVIAFDSVGNTSEAVPTEHEAEEKEKTSETNSSKEASVTSSAEATALSSVAADNEVQKESTERKTIQDPLVSTNTAQMDAMTENITTTTEANKEPTEEKTMTREALASVNTEHEPVDVREETSEAERKVDESPDETTTKADAKTQETSSVHDKPGLEQEVAVQQIAVNDAAVEESTEELTKTDETLSGFQRPEVEQEHAVEETSDSKEVEQSSEKQELLSNEQETKLVEIDFEVKPTFVKTIRMKAAKKEIKPIYGLTTLDNELYIISQHSSDIEIYDSKSLEFKQQFHIEDLFDPVDIASCPINRYLYVFDWKGESNEIFKIDSTGKLHLKWSTGQNGGFLSITPEGNVLLSAWDKSVLIEYSPEGREIREIKLPATIAELRLGIMLTNGNIIVSHGEDEEAEHRVCLLDENGSEIRSFGGVKGFSSKQFDSPNYLAVDRRSGFVLVADQNNKRVVLLDHELEFKREIIEEADGLRYPIRLELNDVSGRLYVADNDYNLNDKVWRDGRIMMFEFSVRQQPSDS